MVSLFISVSLSVSVSEASWNCEKARHATSILTSKHEGWRNEGLPSFDIFSHFAGLDDIKEPSDTWMYVTLGMVGVRS